MIDVVGIEVSGKAREHDDLGLGDRAPGAFPLITDSQILEGEDGPGMASHAPRDPS
jgi:hypothetical protein